MTALRFLAFAVATLCLIACGNDDHKDSNQNKSDDTAIYKSFDDFAAEVITSTSSGATNCGTLAIGENAVAANTCIAESFTNNLAFYAIYQLQGFDSSVGEAVSRDAQGTLYFWSYDSNPAGGIPAIASRVSKETCLQPSLSGVLDNDPKEVFNCNGEHNAIYKSFEDFAAEVTSSASASATNCGHVAISESPVAANTCIAESFTNSLEFYATYQLQGFESDIGAAVSRDAQGTLYFWSYNSNPTGMPASDSRIDKEICLQPSLSGVLNNAPKEVFNCNSEQNVIYKSFADFAAEVTASVSASATHCGTVAIGESTVGANTCIAESFTNNLEFYATFQYQGFDSLVGEAVSRDALGTLYFWSYDSNPSGGLPASDSIVRKTICLQPLLSGALDGSLKNVFTCY